MKSININIKKRFRTYNNIFHYKNINRFLDEKLTEDNALNKTIVVDIDDGYALIVIPTGSKISLELSRVFTSREFHNIDEIEAVLSNILSLNKFKSTYKKTVHVYIYFVSYSEEGKKTVYNAGKYTDIMLW